MLNVGLNNSINFKNMSEFLTNLSDSLHQNDTENVINLLNSPDNNNVTLSEPKVVKTLLKYKDRQIIYAATESVAEWAKIEHNRGILAEKEVIDLLLHLLESDENIVLNVVRALGNICYENEAATRILDKEGLQKILTIFYDLEHSNNTLLQAKLSGLLLNIFISNQDLQFVDKNELLGHISSILNAPSKISTDEFCLYSYLLQIVYTLLVEYDHQIIYPEKLYRKVTVIFKCSNIPELELICLQILYNASEKDDVRKLLVESNVCEKVFELIEKYKGLIDDEESRSILKMACDLINNILIEDESMKLLYNCGKGEVYKNSVKWLDSDDEDLLATAIMAVGNFARNDENCIAIVKEGISKKLIDLLPKHGSSNPDIKLMYGLLSTLKNLVVPSINKSIILEEGFIPSIQPVLEIDQDIVIFKLLGTLRLVIDGQEKAAKDLISQKSFLEKLVKWYDNTYHLGVKREVSRLFAWMIKSCHSWELMQHILQTEGAMSCLVSMFSSEDVVMENEALISLNLLATASKQTSDLADITVISAETSITTKFEEQIVETQIASVLPYIRIFSHSEQMVENLMSLLEKLLQSNLILAHFREKGVLKVLEEHSKNVKAQNCLDKTQNVISILSE